MPAGESLPGLAEALEQIQAPDPHDRTLSKRRWETLCAEFRKLRKEAIENAGATVFESNRVSPKEPKERKMKK